MTRPPGATPKVALPPPGFTRVPGTLKVVPKPGTSVFPTFGECVKERARLRRIATTNVETENGEGGWSRLAQVACVALR